MKELTSILLCLALAACAEKSVDPTPRLPLDESVSISAIEPNVNYRSQSIRIHGTGFHPDSWRNQVLFVGGQSVWADSGSYTVLHVRIPVNAYTGEILVRTPNDSAYGPKLYVISGCPSNVCVIPYDGPTLTEEQSFQLDFFSRPIGWTASLAGDTLKLRHRSIQGDEAHIEWLLNFRLNGTALPTFVEGTIENYSWPSPTEIHPVEGLIQFQSWDTLGVVAAKVSTPLYRDLRVRDFVIWYNFN